ncbi:hypothetical protein BC833DRAFT_576400 [Globomyces pollinis-pini]|nr:hypothetical protein BC833DRAFT_576400 [Globomyces pollinis-pini]
MLQGLRKSRTIKEVFGINSHANFEDFENHPSITQSAKLILLSLPASIPHYDNLSPALWNWLNHERHLSGNVIDYPRVFSPANELISDPLPAHLKKSSSPPPIPSTERPLSASRSTSSTLLSDMPLRKQARKPVPGVYQETYSNDTPEIKRFFVNLMNIQLLQAPNVSSVICVVRVDDQVRCSSPLPLHKLSKQRGSIVVAQCMEGFLFDVAERQRELPVVLKFYTQKSQFGGLSTSPSMSSFTSNTGSFVSKHLRKSTIYDNTPLPEQKLEDKIPANPSDLGTFIAEMTLNIPSIHAFSKITGTHSFSALSKKEIGRVQLQMGIFMDTDFTVLPDILPGFTNHSDYLNFYLLTKGGLIWDKKWIGASPEGLSIYNTYYRESRKPIAYIPFKQLIGVQKAKREFMAAPNCLEVFVLLPWKDDTKLFQPNDLSIVWKDQIAEAGQILNEHTMKIYLSADSDERFDHWKLFFETHIARNRNRKVNF